jgi:hypothetical protein
MKSRKRKCKNTNGADDADGRNRDVADLEAK